jgi:hypothetical protein
MNTLFSQQNHYTHGWVPDKYFIAPYNIPRFLTQTAMFNGLSGKNYNRHQPLGYPLSHLG